MRYSKVVRLGAALCASALLAAACGGDDGASSDTSAAPETTAVTETTEASATTEAPETTEPSLAAQLLWDEGPCDPALPTIHIGHITSFTAPGQNFEDSAIAIEATVEAFNARGGVNGNCLEVTPCDDNSDANQAIVCANEMVNEGVVATVGDLIPVGAIGAADVLEAAGIGRFGITPGGAELSHPATYALEAGSVAAALVHPEWLKEEGFTKIAVIRVDVPQAAVVPEYMATIFGKDGIEIVADIPVPPGSTDFTQFVLAAESAGAEAVAVALDGPNSLLLYQAAQQLGTELTFSQSMTLDRASILEVGEFMSQVRLVSGVPAAAADVPALAIMGEDLATYSDDSRLELGNAKALVTRTWIATYAFIYMLREAGLSEYTAQTVRAAIDASGPIPMLDFLPDWTPSQTNGSQFPRISQSYYGVWAWNPELEFNGEPGNLELIGEIDFLEAIEGTPFGPPAS